MNRNPFLGLLTIVFLLFSLSPYDLAKASVTDVSVRAVPVDGHWTGTTSRGQPMSFDVSTSGTQWATFKLKTDFVIGACSGTVEITVPGPGAITNDAFSRSLSTFSFSGQFTSASTATGNYSFINESVVGCGTFSQSGTWSATTTLPLPGAFSKLSPGDAATGQPANPTLSWGASTNASGYDYCYGTANPCSNWMDNGTATSVALGGLTPGATYYWQVRARNGTGTTLANGGTFWSFSVTQIQILPLYLPLVVKAAQLPGSFSKVTPANAATGQSTSPTLSWAASANTTSYEYCYGTTNPCSNWTDNGPATSKALTGLALDTTYYWQVRANNPAGSTYADGGTWWSFTTAATSTGWTTIVSEDFEGDFPGVWQLPSNTGYTWGKRNCKPYAGSYSGWAVGGGTNGSSLACGSSYPNGVDTLMVYGPFSLAGATAADLSFMLWLNSEINYDGVCAYASIDASNYYGDCISGNSSGWISRVLDLTNVWTLGNLMGKPNVWIALSFHSDSTINKTEGGYVDNIVLRKCTSVSCPASASRLNFDNGLMMETTSHKMIH